jgi:hypothetical protein
MNIKGTISQQYSDNFTFEAEEDADPMYFTSLSLDAEMRYETERQGISLSGSINYWVDTENFDSERVSQSLSLGYNRDLSDYDYISLSDTISYSRYPIDFEEEFGKTETRLNDYRNIFILSYMREVNEDITVRTGYSNSIFWTSRELNARDSVNNTASVNINYQYDIATSFDLGYVYSISEFEDSGFEESDEISIQTVRAGIQRLITKTLEFGGYVGWQFTPAGQDSFTWGISLVNDIYLDEKTEAVLSFSKSFHTSNDGDIFRSWSVRGYLERDILPGLIGNISSFYGEGKFDFSGREDKFFGASCRISYAFNKYLSAGLGYTRSNLDSNDKDREYTRNTIHTGISLTF